VSGLKIVAFVCENHALDALNSARRAGDTLPESVQMIKLPCTGRVESVHLLDAIRSGADGVLVIGCLDENCYHDVGSRLARGRVNRCKDILKDIAVEPERVQMISCASVSGSMLMMKLRQFEKLLSELSKTSPKGARQ
jgi:coenzyme F420-reducing hydrogenase delta subunit